MATPDSPPQGASAAPDAGPTLGPATRIALTHRDSLKPDHQELLRTLMADTGMDPNTREDLVEHLLEEEGPRLMAALSRARSTRVSAEVAAAAVPRGLTVGSLRHEQTWPASGRGSVGSLRHPIDHD